MQGFCSVGYLCQHATVYGRFHPTIPNFVGHHLDSFRFGFVAQSTWARCLCCKSIVAWAEACFSIINVVTHAYHHMKMCGRIYVSPLTITSLGLVHQWDIIKIMTNILCTRFTSTWQSEKTLSTCHK